MNNQPLRGSIRAEGHPPLHDEHRLRPYGIAIGVLFVLFILTDFVFRPNFVSIHVDSDETSRPTPMMVSAAHLLVQFAVVLPIGVIALLDRLDLRRVRAFAGVCAALLFAIALSLFAHPDTKAFANLVTLGWTFVVFGLLASTDYGRSACMRHVLATLTIGCALVLLLVAVDGEYSWGRLAGRVGPNYWGMIAFVTFVSSFALPRMWQRLPIWAIVAYILVETSARGSLVALFVAACVFYGAKFWHTSVARRGWILVPILALCIALPLLVPVVASDLLLLDDARRGVGSGGTGRSIAWGQALDLFKANPWFGVGFRQHDDYITVASSAHNAYLAALAEIGVFGFLSYLMLVVGAAYLALRRAVRQPGVQFAAVAAFLLAFLFLGLVETMWLTIGSPLPFLMILFAANAWSLTPELRYAGVHAELRQRSASESLRQGRGALPAR